MYFVRNIIHTENFIVTVDTKSDTIFRVFSLPDLLLINSIERRGRGPNEFNLINGRSLRFCGQGFNILDMLKLRIINLKKSKDQIFTITLPPEVGIIQDAILINDSLILGYNFDFTKEFFYFNIKSNKITQFEDYPSLLNNMPSVHKSIYLKNIEIRPDKKSG